MYTDIYIREQVQYVESKHQIRNCIKIKLNLLPDPMVMKSDPLHLSL